MVLDEYLFVFELYLFILMLFHVTARYFNLCFTKQFIDMFRLCLFKRMYVPLG